MAALFVSEILLVLFADAEYLGMTSGACPLCSWPTVLHLDRPGIADLHFLPALHTISLHSYLLFEDVMRVALTHEHVNR